MSDEGVSTGAGAADIVTVARGGRRLRAEVYAPAGAGADGPVPGVVVLHESWGLNDDIRRIARRFATAGYAVLAPDLLSWSSPKPLCLVRTLRGGSGPVLADLEACRVAFTARPEVDGARVGIAGFCFGAGFALLAGTGSAYRASAVHYGEVPSDAAALAGTCPVVASYGGRDRVFGPHAARLEAHLAELAVAHDVRTYDDVGHSFMNHEPRWVELTAPVMPMHPAYSHEAAEHAWDRMLAFFATHI